MPALLSLCVDQYHYPKAGTGRMAVGHHVHSIVTHFNSASSMPCLARSFAFDFGNTARESPSLFNQAALDITGRSSQVSDYLGVSRAISFPLSDKAHDALSDLHDIARRQETSLPLIFSRDATPLDLADINPGEFVVANCVTFVPLLLAIAGLSPAIGRNDLSTLTRGHHFHDRLELIDEDHSDRLPDTLGQTFFTADDSLYAYHNLGRTSVVQFMDILGTGLAALAAHQGEDAIWARSHPTVTTNETVQKWLSSNSALNYGVARR